MLAESYRVRLAESGVSPRRLRSYQHSPHLLPNRRKAHDLNYYRHFPGDYLRDTLHLTAAEDGMYRRLLDLAYTTEKPLPFDRLLIYRLTRARSRSDKAAVDKVIEAFFTKTRWGYTHKRVQEEIKYVESRVKAARENGSRGGRPPKEKTQRVSSGKPTGLQKHNPEKSSPDSILHRPNSQDHLVAAGVTVQNSEAAAAVEQVFAQIDSEPFGPWDFQSIFASAVKNGAKSWVDAMERTIQICKASGVQVPGRFYSIKHILEKLDAEQCFKKRPI